MYICSILVENRYPFVFGAPFRGETEAVRFIGLRNNLIVAKN